MLDMYVGVLLHALFPLLPFPLALVAPATDFSPPPSYPRRWRLPPLQLPGRPLWGVYVGCEAANGVVNRVEASTPLVHPSPTR
jgi:hypothetical protein